MHMTFSECERTGFYAECARASSLCDKVIKIEKLDENTNFDHRFLFINMHIRIALLILSTSASRLLFLKKKMA